MVNLWPVLIVVGVICLSAIAVVILLAIKISSKKKGRVSPP